MDTDSDSDYYVEDFIQPAVIKPPINDDSADLLGNFDDKKKEEILSGILENTPMDSESEDDDDETEISEPTTKLSEDQLSVLLKGTVKSNRFVLYVTNIEENVTKQDLMNVFCKAGEVKSIRRPEGKRGKHFAFVEMMTMESFRSALELHNSELNGKMIKIQISEGGKKKSANKKNILKQKNRKLSEMRNEPKAFTKSGKSYDKKIKKEIAKVMVNEKKKWRKSKNEKGGTYKRK